MKSKNNDFRSDEFYDKKYDDTAWLTQREKDGVALINRISELQVFKKGDKMLDAGCGSGDMAKAIMERYKVIAYGTDLNKVAIRRANGVGIKAKIANLDEKWPYENSFFNSIVAAEIIEHVVNPDNFLSEAKRVLKKNGHLVITTPNLAAWFNRLIFLFGFQPFFTEVSTIDKTMGLKFTRSLTPNRETMGHIRVFTLRALKDMLEMHGFEIVSAKGSTVYYLPKYMVPFDYLFKYTPSLSTDMTIVAKKK